MLRALSPETLIASLLEALLAGEPRGGLARAGRPADLQERIAALRAYVEAEVRRRVAEERTGPGRPRSALPPLADQVDFLRAQRDELAAMRRTVQPLARRLASRLAARRRLGREGRLDIRRTVRASLGTGGVPVTTHHRPRRVHKPELVVLCDVSGSVAGFAHFTLMLTAALREQFSRVRAFAFVDTCDEVTRLFGPGADLADSVRRLSREADLVRYDGHSDYGHALRVFVEQVAGRRRAEDLVPAARRRPYQLPRSRPAAAQGPGRRSRHAYWLNPEPGASGAPAIRPRAYGEVIEMVECRNVGQSTEFVGTLLPV